MTTTIGSLIISIIRVTLAISIAAFSVRMTHAQSASADETTFSYQGRLTTASGAPAQGDCDLRFNLHAVRSGGVSLATVTLNGVPVHDGYFTVALDFGSGVFASQPRWLAIEVDCDGAGYTELAPRQRIFAAPQAIHALEAASATSIQQRAVADVAPESGQTLVWDGVQWSPAAHPYTRIVVVSPISDGLDFTANGAALRKSLEGIQGASETAPYLLLVEPGVYDVGGSALQLREYVDMAGAGRGLTTIRGGGSDSSPGATLIGADHVELRQLTVIADSRGVSKYAAGIFNDSVDPALSDVDVAARNATMSAVGVYNENSSAVLERVSIDVSVKSVQAGESAPNATGLRIVGGVGGKLNQVSVYTSGGFENRGVAVENAELRLRNFEVEVRAAASARGVEVQYSNAYLSGGGADAVITIEDSRVSADNIGLYTTKAPLSLLNVTAFGADAGLRTVANGAGAVISVDRSSIGGNAYSLHTTDGYLLRIGGSKLVGARNVAANTATCVFTYDEAYLEIGPLCY